MPTPNRLHLRARTFWRNVASLVLVCAWAGFTPLASSQTADSSNPRADNLVLAMAVQGDGKILLGGAFSTIAGVARSGLARLNADGSIDTSWTRHVIGTVNCLAIQPDEEVLLAGTFSRVSEQYYNRIARFNSSGSLDANFDPGASNAVNALAVQPDGKILVGGSFTGLGGQVCSRIGWLTPFGQLDSAFSGGAGGTVQAIALQTNGAIVVGGSFSTLAGQSRLRIGRLDSSGDLVLDFNPGARSTVGTLILQPDGKILVGGDFVTLAGQPCYRIGRLNADGALDSSFVASASNSVYSVAVQTDGKVLVGGSFTNIAGSARTNICRLNNTALPTQSLSFATSSIDWLRQGTGAEVSRASFDGSTNNVAWNWLGEGTRLTNGWQVNRMGLPGSATIRALGYLTGGQNNGSNWFVETFTGRPVLNGATDQPDQRRHHSGHVCGSGTRGAAELPMAERWIAPRRHCEDFRHKVVHLDFNQRIGGPHRWLFRDREQ